MLLQIADVLTADQLATLVKSLEGETAAFEDGRKTAGWQARDVKNNLQASGPAAERAVDAVKKALLQHGVFKAAAMPKSFVKLLVSRYLPGMEYGTHVDDALMGGVRTDMSFTLFLCDPGTYDGGELVIEGNDGDTEVKLPAGHLVLYPTTTLHRVAPVTRGERLVVVGWVRSFIRSGEDREILFDLENVIAASRAASIDRGILNRLLKVKANLLRKWVED
jgi:PKHD-type hydroxylase